MIDTIEQQIELLQKSYNAKLFSTRKCTIGHKDSKKPLASGWQTKHYATAILRRNLLNGHGIAWALGPHDFVLDVDFPTQARPYKQGDKSLEKLKRLVGYDFQERTPMVLTDTGGQHIYFTLPKGLDPLTLRKQLDSLPGIEFLRVGHYVLVPPSPHWLGGNYRFDDITTIMGDYSRQEVPARILELISATEQPQKHREPDPTIENRHLELLLSGLQVDAYADNDSWFPIMCASHHATGGGGLEEFLSWSLSDPRYSDRRADITHRWNSLSAGRSGGHTIGTLIHELRRFGRDDVVQQFNLLNDFRDSSEFRSQTESKNHASQRPENVASEPIAPVGGTAMQRIIYKLNEKELCDELSVHISATERCYSRLGELVEVSIANNRALVEKLTPLSICRILSDLIELGQFKKNPHIWQPVRIPKRVGQQLEEMSQWPGVPELKRVTNVPILSERGIISSPGYDPMSKMYYFDPDYQKLPPLLPNPTHTDALQALKDLRDLVSDVCFANNAHRAAFLAALMGVVARPLLGPIAPLVLIDGNRSGVGKGLLVDIVGNIVYGYTPAKTTGFHGNKEEQRKELLSFALLNPQMITFDNLPSGGKFGSNILDSILTSGRVMGRELGFSKIVEAEFDSVFFATANRIQLDPDADLRRRILYVLLESPLEDPSKRGDWKYPDIIGHVLQQRHRYLWDCLTIVEAARQNHASLPQVSPWASFQGWNLVRQSLVWLGEPDPRLSLQQIETSTTDHTNLALIIRALELLGACKNPMTSREIVEAMTSWVFKDSDAEKHDQECIRQAQRILTSCSGDPANSVGTVLSRDYRDQVLDGRWIRGTRNNRKSMLWTVVSVEQGMPKE